MDVNDIEVLPDGRIVLVLHSGRIERPMSTHEVKKAFMVWVEEVGPGRGPRRACLAEAVDFAKQARMAVLK